MAESFYKFQDTKISSPSRNLKDFEEEWLQLGEDFSIVFVSGNSPKDPDQTLEKESTKRKINETEDSLILIRRKMLKQNYNGGFTQLTSEDDPILKTFRFFCCKEETPEKFKVIERRTRCNYTLDFSVPRNIQASTGATQETSGCDQVTSPFATQYPLQEELGTLSDLVDSLRVDHFQTSMLVNYIQDYIKKWK